MFIVVYCINSSRFSVEFFFYFCLMLEFLNEMKNTLDRVQATEKQELKTQHKESTLFLLKIHQCKTGKQ